MDDEMHAEFRFVEFVDQDDGVRGNRICIKAQPVVEAFGRITGEMVRDGVVDAGKRSLHDRRAESFGALPEEILEASSAESVGDIRFLGDNPRGRIRG